MPDTPTTTAPASVWDQLAEAIAITGYRPKRREGLAWREFTPAHDDPYVIIENPAEAVYLRLSPGDFFLFQQMDGSRTVQDLVVAYMLRFRRFALDDTVSLVADLRNNGFLVDPPYPTYQRLRALTRRPGPGRFLDRYVQLFFNHEYPIQGIDGFLSAAYGRGFRVLFTRPAQILLAAVTLVGVPLLAWHAVGEHVSLRIRSSAAISLPLYYLFFIAVALVHEMAHALTVKSFGHTVRRGGFTMFYGIPGLYVDTQDMWMETRWPRVAVSWAGPYSGFILAGLAGLAVTAAPGASWAEVVLLLGIVALVVNLFQLMPLIQLDGYFMLMDFLEIPDLRRRALSFLWHDLWPKLRRRQKFNREERIFTVFGLLAAVYTVYAVYLGASFWWGQARAAFDAAARTHSPAAIAALALLTALLVPFVLGLIRRLSHGGEVVYRTARHAAETVANHPFRRREQLLAQVPALARLGPAAVRWLAHRLREVRVPPGTTILEAGRPNDRFFLIERGQAEVFRPAENGGPASTTLGPLDYFGEEALLASGPSRATVRAATPLDLLVLDAQDFCARLAADIAADAALRARKDERAEMDAFPLFAAMGAREKDLLLPALRPAFYPAGQVIYRAGEPAQAFYLLRSGRVTLSNGPAASDPAAHTLGPGAYFGEEALLRATPHGETARALEDTRLWEVRRDEVEDVFERYFDLAHTLAAAANAELPPDLILVDPADLAARPEISLGEPAPDFTLPALDGTTFTLSAERGKRLLLWFSSGYSAAADRQAAVQRSSDLPTLRKAGIRLVQLAPEPVAVARAFYGDRAPPFPVLGDPEKEIYRRYGLYDRGSPEAPPVSPGPPAPDPAGDRAPVAWLDALRQAVGAEAPRPQAVPLRQGLFLVDVDGTVRNRSVLSLGEALPAIGDFIGALAEGTSAPA